MNTITLTDIELIEFITNDHKNSYLWQSVHINKHRKHYYVTMTGRDIDGKYITKLQQYFEIVNFESTEERCITFKLRRKNQT